MFCNQGSQLIHLHFETEFFAHSFAPCDRIFQAKEAKIARFSTSLMCTPSCSADFPVYTMYPGAIVIISALVNIDSNPGIYIFFMSHIFSLPLYEELFSHPGFLYLLSGRSPSEKKLLLFFIFYHIFPQKLILP